MRGTQSKSRSPLTPSHSNNPSSSVNLGPLLVNPSQALDPCRMTAAHATPLTAASHGENGPVIVRLLRFFRRL